MGPLIEQIAGALDSAARRLSPPRIRKGCDSFASKKDA